MVFHEPRLPVNKKNGYAKMHTFAQNVFVSRISISPFGSMGTSTSPPERSFAFSQANSKKQSRK